ncbi:MAG TPA: carbohydrate ABC transporter permease [Planctomycetota bacterium]|nr:carbohydrate ABC transporter permease [Planctomycetota bacterium]
MADDNAIVAGTGDNAPANGAPPGGTRAGEAPVKYWRGPKSWFMHATLGGIGFFFLVPLVWMASTSLKPPEQTMETPPRLLPYGTLANLNGHAMLVARSATPMGYDGYVVVLDEELPGAPPLKGERRDVTLSAFAIAARTRDDGPLAPADQPPRQAPNAAGFARIETSLQGQTAWPWIHAHVEHPFSAADFKVTEVRASADYAASGSSAASSAGPIAKQDLQWDIQPKAQLTEKIRPMWENYPASLKRMNFMQYLFNTIFVCLMTVSGVVVSSVLIAYAFAFLPFPGRGVLFGLTLATMMVPFPVTMIVMYNLYRDLGWIGSFKPLWIGAWFGSPFFIFLLRQFFLGLPKELLDAARMDGCGELEILWHVVLPLSRPAIAMVALFTFLGSWSDFMGPLLYLSNKDSFTLALGLANYRGQHGGTDFGLLMAANLVFSLPLIILFLCTIKTFIKGIATTGMKG